MVLTTNNKNNIATVPLDINNRFRKISTSANENCMTTYVFVSIY